MKSEYQKYIDKARDEILYPTFEVTKQYLAVHEVEFEQGLPKVKLIELDFNESIVAVFFPIKDERFFLEIHLKKPPEIMVDFIWIASGHHTYLTATSKDLSYEELAQLLNFSPLEGFSKGDLRQNKKSRYNFSRISFKPLYDETYDLNRQLNLLLDELEKDREGVRRLTEKANAYISICRYQYVSGNAGINIDIGLINRLSKLNLGIDIDTYIGGNALKED